MATLTKDLRPSWHLGCDIAHNGAWSADELVLQQLLHNQQRPDGVCTVREEHVISCDCLEIDPCSIYTSIVDDDLRADNISKCRLRTLITAEVASFSASTVSRKWRFAALADCMHFVLEQK